LKSERVTLRKVRDDDVAERQSLGYHPEIVKGYGVLLTAPVATSTEEATKWVNDIATNNAAWIIEYKTRLIGSIRLDHIDLNDMRCSLAVGIVDPAALGMGLGQEAIELCVTHAFEELQLHRISVRVLASNQRAIRCYKKCGFEEEGRERESALVNGQWEDDLIMGLVKK
jgi:RimJ/RimL family protein N-acetyltransferase